MKKQIFILVFFILNGFLAISQVSDSDIAHALLGKNHYEIPTILNSLKIWHHMHIVERAEKTVRWFSIADGNGVVKVYRIGLSFNTGYIVNEVMINFRHDSKEQVESSLKITDADDYHVGSYSTDFIFKLK